MTQPSDLKIAAFTLGAWMTNCYVLHPADGRRCWIVDAGFEPEPMIRYIQQHDLEPEQVVLTHAHVDHIAGLSTVRAYFPGVPIAIHEAEQAFPADPMLNLSAALMQPIVAPAPSGFLDTEAGLRLGGIEFEVRHTPGHSPGGVTLYQREAGVAVVGDTLFAGSVGRTDFPTSDPGRLFESIRDKLLTLPGDTRVLPGHGPETTIDEERRHNPFL